MELLTYLPLWYQVCAVGIFGLIIGSFLNVVIYRLHTGRSLAGSSHCLSCGKPLRWYELLPVVSYIGQRGRCRGCGSYIPLRYALVELLTATLYLWLWVAIPLGWSFLLWLVLLAVLVVIVVYDLYHLIIPDELTATIAVVSVGIFIIQFGVSDLTAWLWAGAGAGIALLIYGGLWAVSRGRWIGFGDVKLALPLAFVLGAGGSASFVVLSFWVGAVISVSLLGIQWLLKRGQRHLSFLSIPLTMKSEVPFAPFLILAFLLVALSHISAIELIDVVFRL